MGNSVLELSSDRIRATDYSDVCPLLRRHRRQPQAVVAVKAAGTEKERMSQLTIFFSCQTLKGRRPQDADVRWPGGKASFEHFMRYVLG